jgi:hypothetical protein
MTAMTAMTAAPKKENASGQGRAGLGREGLGRAGAGVHRPTRSHASFCLRLYLLVDKESGERRADSGREKNATIGQSTRPRLARFSTPAAQ